MRNIVLQGDALKVLRTLASESVDALVTDPPAGIGFMGREWDSNKGGRTSWVSWLADVLSEAKRVLKPGAHALVWALPRTSHWTACAVEDAGFEVRDVITHVFGTGFPKSLDVSKAIDKAAGAEREVVGTYRVSGNALTPTKLKGGTYGVRVPNSAAGDLPITAPATDEAKQWAGWGTALKPASEHWILARKPFEGTVAGNVLEHGTGALNIDGCRVPHTPGSEGAWATTNRKNGRGVYGDFADEGGAVPTRTRNDAGRWPTNLVLSHSIWCTADECADGCPVKVMDAQSGLRKTNARPNCKGKPYGDTPRAAYGKFTSVPYTGGIEDSGGASRYFPVFTPNEDAAPFLYAAKASRAERGADNTHPTVKSQALMRWLVRLITPPGGLVLDCFAGSGSTGVACVSEGFDYLLIEREAEYAHIARARLAKALSARAS